MVKYCSDRAGHFSRILLAERYSMQITQRKKMGRATTSLQSTARHTCLALLALFAASSVDSGRGDREKSGHTALPRGGGELHQLPAPSASREPPKLPLQFHNTVTLFVLNPDLAPVWRQGRRRSADMFGELRTFKC